VQRTHPNSKPKATQTVAEKNTAPIKAISPKPKHMMKVNTAAAPEIAQQPSWQLVFLIGSNILKLLSNGTRA
jgi:hypothetical protein